MHGPIVINYPSAIPIISFTARPSFIRVHKMDLQYKSFKKTIVVKSNIDSVRTLIYNNLITTIENRSP